MTMIFIYGGLFVVIFSVGLARRTSDNCQKHRLTGGSRSDEGVLEVFFNNRWVNVCYQNNSDILGTICRSATKSTVDLDEYAHDDNVYRATLLNKRINYTMCSNDDVTSGNDSYSTCESVLSICCHDIATAPCSNNWNATVQSREYTTYYRRIIQLGYSEIIVADFSTTADTSTIMKSWTKSFLQDLNTTCEEQAMNATTSCGSYVCKSTCNVTSNLVFVMFCPENKTCCMTEEEYRYLQTNSNCSIRNLTVVEEPNNKNVTPQFCIAAEVINGTAFVSIEECSRYLQSFNISKSHVGPKTSTKASTSTNKGSNVTFSPTRNSIKNTTNTTEPAKPIITAGQTEPFNMVVVIVIAVVSLALVTAFVVVGVVIYRMFRKIEKGREKPRPNSVANHGYALEVFQHPRVDDEEYTLISDMEQEHNSAEQFKPKLPARNSENKEKIAKEVDLITLAEYSVPSDNIRDGCKISQTSDYCMTTYDDPIRLKLKLKEKLKNDAINSCNDDADLEIKESETNAGHLERQSCNSNIVDIHCDTAAADNGSATNHEAMLETESKVIQGEAGKSEETKELDDGYEDGFGPLKQSQAQIDDDIEGYLEGVGNKCNNIDANGDVDYEDPGILDGKYQNECSVDKLFEEHVCLSCLKPEHLTKLGIKIITDDMYEKSKNFQRCFSDPVSRSYVADSMIDVDDSCCTDTSRNKNIERKENERNRQEDGLQELHVARRNKSVSNGRRCSVCNTVYDRLGNMPPNVWTNNTDNVYDQFGNFKHFKHRKQIGGKRMNSN